MGALEQLYEEHYDLCVALGSLRHERYLSGLPEGYVSLRAPGAVRLELTMGEKAVLLAKELRTRLRLLELTTEIHELKFGSVPAWVGAGVVQLRSELDQAFM